MCGIYGFARKEGPLNMLERFRLRGVVMDLAFLNETRGRDGTGIALLFPEKRIMFKEATPAGKLLKTKRFQGMIREITDRTQVCLGHTRLATIGDIRNAHCHPFESEHFLGVHNGHFMNREALLKKYGKETETPVDSEAIFRVLDGEANVKGLISKLSEMEGDFALGFSFKYDPHRLFLIRNADKPLHVAYAPGLRTLFWSSDAEHLEYALARNGLKGSVWAIKEDHLYIADVRNFTAKSHLRKTACKMKSYEGAREMLLAEDDFRPGRQPAFFSFDDLQEFGFFEGSGMNEHSKIPCAVCRQESETGELFYDEMSRRFLCDACSFDCLDSYESGQRQIQSQEETRDLLEVAAV